ncbi:MAG TPA: heparan-alpha-glucosaminide N-acetyltransferase domain-containing protein [Candidatus Lokiarchaeia archaeon]|nr:heparan-alpha-glucosaminide N-acetyltransferase domain-containing protein [Candidatus Lokiarchaeia archaeon]
MENGSMQGLVNGESAKAEPATKRRITTIDTMKGMSMIMIFYAHFAFILRTSDWTAFTRIQWLFLDFFGPAMFVTMSMLGTMLGSAGGKDLSKREPLYPRRSLIKITYLLIVGEIINLITLGGIGILHVFEWNVVTAIAIFSLVMPLILRMKMRWRMVLIVLIVMLYYPLLNFSMSSINAAGVDPGAATPAQINDLPTIIYFLFFQQAMTCPLFPWLLVPLITSIIFEPFCKAYRSNAPGAIQAELRKIGYVGLIFIAGAIALGFWLVPGYTRDIMPELSTPGQFFTYPFAGVPVFLVRHTPQYIFYNLGIICVIFSILAERQLIQQKRILWEEKINNVGIMSLTLFLMSHVSWLFQWIHVQALVFYSFFIPLVFIVVNAYWYWNKRGKMIGSLEWAMVMYTMAITRALGRFDKGSIDVGREKPRVVAE